MNLLGLKVSNILIGMAGTFLLFCDHLLCTKALYSTPTVLVDENDRISVVLGGIPPAATGHVSVAGKCWQNDIDSATNAIKACRQRSSFTAKELNGRRGGFAQRTAGYGYGNGRKRPLNYKISGKKENKAAMEELLRNPGMRRISGFANCLWPFSFPFASVPFCLCLIPSRSSLQLLRPQDLQRIQRCPPGTPPTTP